MGHKVTTGIAEELLLLSIRHGYNTLDRAWLTGQATGTAAAMIALSGHIRRGEHDERAGIQEALRPPRHRQQPRRIGRNPSIGKAAAAHPPDYHPAESVYLVLAR